MVLPSGNRLSRVRTALARASLAVFALLLAGCGGRSSDTGDAAVADPAVEVLVVQPSTVRETTTLTGVLEAIRAVDVVSEVSGKVERLNRDVGDAVAASTILAALEKDVPRETLNQAEATLMSADARYAVAREDYRRDSTLALAGDIAPAVLESSRMAATAAAGDLKAARAARELTARNLAQADIRAPFAGIVARRFCNLGTYATPGMPLFRVVDLDSLRLSISAGQQDVARVRRGSEVLVRSEALPGEVFRGRVRSIAPQADERTRTFPVEVILANPPDSPLRDGLVVRADLVLSVVEEAITVPREAVQRAGDGEFVYVVVDSLAQRRPVRSGGMVEERLILTEGLRPGETVVIVGMQNLRDGVRVRLEGAATAREGEER